MVAASSFPQVLKTLHASTLRDPAAGVDVLTPELLRGPTVVLVLRRPGCILCREEAQRLWARAAEIQALGAQLICVVHEWRDREIAAFAPEFWGGAVYHDTSKAFYKAVNGGENVLRGSALGLLNPFSSAWKRIMEARKHVGSHNVVGEGLIMGGLLVLGAGGTGPYLMHLETDLGVHADHEEVMDAVRHATSDASGADAKAGSQAAGGQGAHAPVVA